MFPFVQLLCSADPKLLKLSKHDDWIYSKFRLRFPDLKIDEIEVDTLKSGTAKEVTLTKSYRVLSRMSYFFTRKRKVSNQVIFMQKWRKFCEEMKQLEDFSFGTLLRLKAKEEYSEENTILVTRVQYLAIEIARNREGFNDFVYQTSNKQSNSSPS